MNRCWWWGVDPGTVRVSVAGVDAGGEHWARTHVFTKHPARSFDRLRAIYVETDVFLRRLAVEFPPVFVLVEQPGGRTVEPQLSYAVGCIQACVPVVGPGALVPVSSWKKAGLGYGGAKKPDIMRWARSEGYAGSLQDEADALGIAFACRELRRPVPVQEQLVA